jgi:hypothetical protein
VEYAQQRVRATKPCFFCPPHPKRDRSQQNPFRATKSLLFLPPAPEQIRISGWRPGSFKLENLILNHERKPKPTLSQIQFQNLV